MTSDKHIEISGCDYIGGAPRRRLTYAQMRGTSLLDSLENSDAQRNNSNNSTPWPGIQFGHIWTLSDYLGYIEITAFQSAECTQPITMARLTKVMKPLEKCKKIIIDLRRNEGGFAQSSINFVSLFAGSQPKYLFTRYLRIRAETGGVIQAPPSLRLHTASSRLNLRNAEKELFILVSKHTFSAAEAAVYSLKKLIPNAIIVGERTAGGQNGDWYPLFIYDNVCHIPYLEYVDEEDRNQSWEGKGISTDVSVLADSALNYAIVRALSHPITSTDSLSMNVIHMPPAIVSTVCTQEEAMLAGSYGKAELTCVNGKFRLRFDGGLEQELEKVAPKSYKTNNGISIVFKENISGGVQVWSSKGYGCTEIFNRVIK